MRKAVVIAITLVLGGAFGAAVEAGPKVEAPRVGLLIVDHGEPPEYNADTYYSFRAFLEHLMDMGIIPAWLKTLDAGTVLQDIDCYACAEESESPDLIDAWLHHHDGPAVHVAEVDPSLPAHYVIPGGPGLGEPDIFEHAGLITWNEWELMGGTSPNYSQKLAKKKVVISDLQDAYPRLPIRVGYAIDPHLGGGTQSIRKALLTLVNQDRVEHIVVAYHGIGFSDIMQTHMIRHELEETLAAVAPEVTISYAEAIGTSPAYVDAVADRAVSELERFPDSAPAAIHLSGHGLSTTMCGDYNCGEDSYHAVSLDLFRRTRKAIMTRVDRAGRFGVFRLYGDGAEGDSDPDNLVDSPIEALAKRKEEGFRYVVDIPFEFDSDSRDTLIILRDGYGRPIPDWGPGFQSTFRYDGMKVRITNVQFGFAQKVKAFESVIIDALEHIDPSTGHEH